MMHEKASRNHDAYRESQSYPYGRGTVEATHHFVISAKYEIVEGEREPRQCRAHDDREKCREREKHRSRKSLSHSVRILTSRVGEKLHIPYN